VSHAHPHGEACMSTVRVRIVHVLHSVRTCDISGCPGLLLWNVGVIAMECRGYCYGMMETCVKKDMY
jgi:hypothetical protein